MTLKYTEAEVTFAEVPNEVTLCINISNCPNRCKGCHSPHLWEDIGEPLDLMHLTDLIDSSIGITCVCIMGGDADPIEVDDIAASIKEYYPGLKVAWYSGNDTISKDIAFWNFDYIKIGSYKEDLGPLNCKATNQKFFKVVNGEELIDITDKFWKHEN